MISTRARLPTKYNQNSGIIIKNRYCLYDQNLSQIQITNFCILGCGYKPDWLVEKQNT